MLFTGGVSLQAGHDSLCALSWQRLVGRSLLQETLWQQQLQPCHSACTARPPCQQNPALLWEWQAGECPVPAAIPSWLTATPRILLQPARHKNMFRYQCQDMTVYCMCRTTALLENKEKQAILFFHFLTMENEVKVYFHSLQSKSTWQAIQSHFFFFLCSWL